MIHVENVTINIQAPGAESGPTSGLGDALLHAMAESLFAEQAEEELDSDAEAQPPTNPPRMSSQQQRADAWMEAPGSAKENAVAAIRAMAKAR